MLSRFFIAEPISHGAPVDLPDEAAHHALRVLRLKQGDRVIVFDGRGGEWSARIARLKPTVGLALDSFADENRSSELRITLAQGLPAADKMDWVIQKAAELGVAAIRPIAAKRSVVRLSGEKMQRRHAHWRNVAISACEQCGANLVPAIAPLVDLSQYLALPPDQNDLRLLLLPGGETRVRDMPKPKGGVTVLVGPEGGFEDEEIAIAHHAGFMPVTFGPRVLRTETAGLAVLAAMMAQWGDC
jgi:16S rRNA (uracil1498-N3)-methyltransferase